MILFESDVEITSTKENVSIPFVSVSHQGSDYYIDTTPSLETRTHVDLDIVEKYHNKIDSIVSFRESLLIKALENSFVKLNYQELLQELLTEQISEDDFEQAIDKYPEKYTIDIHELDNDAETFNIILDIIKKLNHNIRNLSTLDVSELFSLDIQEEYNNQIKNQNTKHYLNLNNEVS